MSVQAPYRLQSGQRVQRRPQHLLLRTRVHNIDPTRTTGLRAAFVRDLNRRFEALIRVIVQAIVHEDVFGLFNGELTILQDMRTPGRRAFDFPRDSRKVSAFMTWIRGQVEAGILDVREINQIGEGVEKAWHNKYIFDSYKRGVTRARAQLRRSGALGLELPDFANQDLAITFTTPVHLDRVGTIYTRVYNELKGITDAMDQQISRILAEGLAEGANPQTLARRLVQVVSGRGDQLAITDSLGRFIPAKRRAQMMARTEVIRAHSHGQLQEFANWGVAGVEVQAEFITAGDERVCAQCQGFEGQYFPIEQAWNIIPVHPSCRCAWIPILTREIINNIRRLWKT